jgi:hypothetical protein
MVLDSGVLVRADSPEIASQASQGPIQSGLYESQDVLLSFFRCEGVFECGLDSLII